MKLKTLKDFKKKYESYCYDCEGFVGSPTNEFSVKLKQEAIKHIKESENGYDWICDMIETNIWIKYFFNITKEDLK